MDVCTLDGQQRRSMTFQVARVTKALGSVSQMVKNGNKLVFDQDSSGKDTSYIQNKRSNEKIWLRHENGVYVFDLRAMIEALIRMVTGRDNVYDACKPD